MEHFYCSYRTTRTDNTISMKNGTTKILTRHDFGQILSFSPTCRSAWTSPEYKLTTSTRLVRPKSAVDMN